MFTSEERELLRRELLAFAQSDERLSAGAITGSAAVGNEDAWSDIDLAFGVRDTDMTRQVIDDWTERIYTRHSAVHHTDVVFASWVYRVFLLSNTLQVDVAFTAAQNFRALAPTVRLVFGDVASAPRTEGQAFADFIGLGWLHALHARTALARNRLWQAEYMVSGIRDNTMALACLRYGLATMHGRGLHLLPAELAASFEPSLIRGLNPVEVSRAFQVIVHLFLEEVRLVDVNLAERLDPVIRSLIDCEGL